MEIYFYFDLIHLVLLEIFKDFKVSTCFFVSFSKAFPKGEYAKLACSIISFLLESNISQPLRYSYLSGLSEDNADVFSSSLLISYCSLLSLLLFSIVTISFYILLKSITSKT